MVKWSHILRVAVTNPQTRSNEFLSWRKHKTHSPLVIEFKIMILSEEVSQTYLVSRIHSSHTHPHSFSYLSTFHIKKVVGVSKLILNAVTNLDIKKFVNINKKSTNKVCDLNCEN